MHTLTMHIRLERDEQTVDGFPIVDTIERPIGALQLQGFELAREGDDVYAPLPLDEIWPRVLLVQVDGPAVRLRVGTAHTTSNVPLEDGGLLLVFDGSVLGLTSAAAAAQTRLVGLAVY